MPTHNAAPSDAAETPRPPAFRTIDLSLPLRPASVVRCRDWRRDLGIDNLFADAFTCPMFGKVRTNHVGPCANFVAKPVRA
jgi:hypothetical protein